MRHLKIFSISVCFVLIAICSQPAKAADSQWSHTIIDRNGRKGAISVDSSGYPAIAFITGSVNALLKFARFDGSEWQYEDPGGSSDVYSVSMAFSPAGAPYLVYDDSAWGQIWVAEKEGGEWRSGLVDDHFSFGLGPSGLAFDSKGVAHVVFCGQDGFNSMNYMAPVYIKHAWFDGEGWEIEKISSDAGESSSPSIAIGPDDSLHVAWLYSGRLMYASGRGENRWQTEILDGPEAGILAESGGVPAVDNNGRVAVCYGRRRSAGFRALYLAISGEDGWSYERVAGDMDSGPAGVGYACSVRMDAATDIHVMFRNVEHDGSHTINYAVQRDGEWGSYGVASSGADRSVSFALDHCGTPHLAYYTGNIVLEYAAPPMEEAGCSVFEWGEELQVGGSYRLDMPCVRLVDGYGVWSQACWGVSLVMKNDGSFRPASVSKGCMKHRSDRDSLFYPDGTLVLPTILAGEDVYGARFMMDSAFMSFSLVPGSVEKRGSRESFCAE